MERLFSISITMLKGEVLKTPIHYFRKHEMQKDETVEYVAERYWEEAQEEYDLLESDEVVILCEGYDGE